MVSFEFLFFFFKSDYVAHHFANDNFHFKFGMLKILNITCEVDDEDWKKKNKKSKQASYLIKEGQMYLSCLNGYLVTVLLWLSMNKQIWVIFFFFYYIKKR